MNISQLVRETHCQSIFYEFQHWVMHLIREYVLRLSQCQKLTFFKVFYSWDGYFRYPFHCPSNFHKRCVLNNFKVVPLPSKIYLDLTSRMLNGIKLVYFKNQGGSLIKKEDNSTWKWKTMSKLNRVKISKHMLSEFLKKKILM